MLPVYRLLFKRECLVIWRCGADWLGMLAFFAIVVALVPMVVLPAIADASVVLTVVAWMVILLNVVLAQEVLWREDYNSGALQQFVLGHVTHIWWLLLRIGLHWLFFILPLIMLTALFAYSVSMPLASIKMLCYSLLLGTPGLALIGSLCGVLTVVLPRGGLLLSLVSLPLFVPVMVLGCGAVLLSLNGVISNGHLALLVALDLIALIGIPPGIYYMLREVVG